MVVYRREGVLVVLVRLPRPDSQEVTSARVQEGAVRRVREARDATSLMRPLSSCGGHGGCDGTVGCPVRTRMFYVAVCAVDWREATVLRSRYRCYTVTLVSTRKDVDRSKQRALPYLQKGAQRGRPSPQSACESRQ